MELLLEAHGDVGGELVSAGGTGTYDINTWATEIQAGSYALMDSAYGKLALPFRQALTVLATVVSVSAGWAVADCGVKALGMDHGDPTIEGAEVWFCSDEHVTFAPRAARAGRGPGPGDPVACRPHRGVPRAHVRGRRRRRARDLARRPTGLVSPGFEPGLSSRAGPG